MKYTTDWSNIFSCILFFIALSIWLVVAFYILYTDFGFGEEIIEFIKKGV